MTPLDQCSMFYYFQYAQSLQFFLIMYVFGSFEIVNSFYCLKYQYKRFKYLHSGTVTYWYVLRTPVQALKKLKKL